EAIEGYRDFIRVHPAHPEVAYAQFRMADAYFRQIPDDWFLAPPAYERDQGPSRNALEQLKKFVHDHPEDERVPRAQKMIRKTLSLLARHELYVARFYLRRGAINAAVMRLRTLLSTYHGSEIDAEALLLLGRTYLEIPNRRLARDA